MHPLTTQLLFVTISVIYTVAMYCIRGNFVYVKIFAKVVKVAISSYVIINTGQFT